MFDAKTGEDITRSVLAQIIFEQENKEGQSLLPIAFLRQLIRFYGDSMQMMVPRFLEQSMSIADQRAGQIPRSDLAGLRRRRRLRPDGRSRAAQHGNVREDLRHVRAALRARRQAGRSAAASRQAGNRPARWTSSSVSSTRCRSGSTSSAAREVASAGLIWSEKRSRTVRIDLERAPPLSRAASASHGRSAQASPISAPCR